MTSFREWTWPSSNLFPPLNCVRPSQLERTYGMLAFYVGGPAVGGRQERVGRCPSAGRTGMGGMTSCVGGECGVVGVGVCVQRLRRQVLVRGRWFGGLTREKTSKACEREREVGCMR